MKFTTVKASNGMWHWRVRLADGRLQDSASSYFSDEECRCMVVRVYGHTYSVDV